MFQNAFLSFAQSFCFTVNYDNFSYHREFYFIFSELKKCLFRGLLFQGGFYYTNHGMNFQMRQIIGLEGINLNDFSNTAVMTSYRNEMISISYRVLTMNFNKKSADFHWHSFNKNATNISQRFCWLHVAVKSSPIQGTRWLPFINLLVTISLNLFSSSRLPSRL